MGETPTGSIDTGAVTTGPATFSDPGLSWTEDSSASTPLTETPEAVSTSADAIVPPAPETPADGSTPASGEPPRDRWDTILANARQKAADEALAPYAWAKQVDASEFQQIQQIAKHFVGGDPIAGLQSLMAEIRKDPQHDAALRSMAARALAQRSQAPQGAAPDLNPRPLMLEDGSTFSAYSSEQVQALVERAVASVKQEFEPVVRTHQTLQEEREKAAQSAQVERLLNTTWTDLQTWPGMQDKATLADVGRAMHAMGLPDDASVDRVQLALNQAYRQVVLPKISQSAEAKLLDTLKTKAAASSSVNPGSAGSAAPRSPKSFSDPSLQW